MNVNLIIGLLLILMPSCGEKKKFDCDNILNQTPYFINGDLNETNDSIIKDFEILINCGELDSIDSELLKGPILSTVILQLINEDKEITYNSVLDVINDFKKTENYDEFREIVIALKSIENKIVSLNDFEKDKEFLTIAGYTPLFLEGFKEFILSNSSQKMTYKNAIFQYSNINKNNLAQESERLEFFDLISLESAIKEAKEKNKKVLLFFSSHSSASAKKMQDSILSNNEVKSILSKNFICFIAYTDDRSEDPVSNSTVGKKNLKIQIDNFEANYQPHFCILDKNGKLLSEIGYTNQLGLFLSFLNSAGN